jgi:hypothetical protein
MEVMLHCRRDGCGASNRGQQVCGWAKQRGGQSEPTPHLAAAAARRAAAAAALLPLRRRLPLLQLPLLLLQPGDRAAPVVLRGGRRSAALLGATLLLLFLLAAGGKEAGKAAGAGACRALRAALRLQGAQLGGRRGALQRKAMGSNARMGDCKDEGSGRARLGRQAGLPASGRASSFTAGFAAKTASLVTSTPQSLWTQLATNAILPV